MEWENRITEGFGLLWRQIATAEYTSGPLFYLILFGAAAFCCFSGYRVYRAVLAVLAFSVVFVLSATILRITGLNSQMGTTELLLLELGLGLAAGFLAWKVFLVGVFAAGYFLGVQHLPRFFDGIYRPVVSSMGAGFAGYLCVRATRMVIIVLTAVIGGFTMVNALVELAGCFPESLPFTLPPANSLIWLAGKALFTFMGVMVQKKSRKKD